MRRPHPSLIALLLAAATLAGCGRAGSAANGGGGAASGSGAGSSAGAPATGKVVNLYTARHYDADQLVYDAFQKKTGIRVRWLEMPSPQLIARMKAEGTASSADVVLIADAGSLWLAEQAGLFQAVKAPDLDARVPAEIRDPQGRWWAFSRRARVIAYDKTRVKPEQVATYEALTSPQFKKGVCVRSSDNEYNLSLMASFISHWGQAKALAWAKGVVANLARPPAAGDIDQIRAVGAGACQVALTNTYYYLRIAASGNADDKRTAARVGLAFPEQATTGTHVNISGGGVAANAPHKAEALQFLRFLASDEAQRIFAEANHEYPAVPSVKPPADVAAIANFKADTLPLSELGRNQAGAQVVYNQAGWR